MIPPKRRESPAGDQFSFASSKNRATNTPQFTENRQQSDYNNYAERIKGNNSRHFGRSDDLKFGAWTRRDRPLYDDENDLKHLIMRDGDDSDTPSPPLWKNSGSPDENSPNSRAQQIEKFRQEMLQIVRDMPENLYELSLRDIVESSPTPRTAKAEEQSLVKGMGTGEKKGKRKQRKMSRNDSFEAGGGFLIKMFVPSVYSSGVGARGKNSKSIGGSASAKVSPRPSFSENEKGYASDREWWHKSSSNGGSGSNSSGSSSSSKSSSTVSRIRKMTSCCSFLHRNKEEEE